MSFLVDSISISPANDLQQVLILDCLAGLIKNSFNTLLNRLNSSRLKRSIFQNFFKKVIKANLL